MIQQSSNPIIFGLFAAHVLQITASRLKPLSLVNPYGAIYKTSRYT